MDCALELRRLFPSSSIKHRICRWSNNAAFLLRNHSTGSRDLKYLNREQRKKPLGGCAPSMTAQLKREFTTSIVFQRANITNAKNGIFFASTCWSATQSNGTIWLKIGLRNGLQKDARENSLVEIDLAPLRAAGRFACGFHNDADFLSAIFFFFTFAVNAMESFR